MSGNGRLVNGEIDPKITKERKRREDTWMLNLRTVYPYGLNDSLNFTPDVPGASCDGVNGVVGKLFPSLSRFHSRSARIHNHNSTQSDNVDFLSNIKLCLDMDPGSSAFNIRKLLTSMRKSHLKKIALQLNEFLSNVSCDFLYFQWYRMALDIIETKLYILPKSKKVKSIPKNKMCIPFMNKALDFINLPKILRSSDVLKNTPHVLELEDMPMVIYSLCEPIRSSILNYKQFVKQLDLDLFCRDSKSVLCQCKNYSNQFIDPSCNHVLTGDLGIIKNNKLRKLISKGPKYREPENVDWIEAKNVIQVALESFIQSVCSSKGISPPYFDNWKFVVLSIIDSKISHFSSRVNSRQVHKVLENSIVKRELKELQKCFILVPIDKAANNIAFICKQHYASILRVELGYTGRSTRSGTCTSLTYGLLNNVNSDEIVKQQISEVEKYGLNIEEEMKYLPTMY